MKMRNVSLAVALVLVAACVSQAGVTNLSVVQTPNSGIGEFTTNDLMVDFTGNIRAQGMLLELSQGTIYADSFGNNAVPSQAFISLAPTLAFDSFLTLGAAATPGVAGTIQAAGDMLTPGGTGADIPGGGAPLVFSDTKIDAVWAPGGGINFPGRDDFLVARLSLSNDAMGTVKFFGTTEGQSSNEWYRADNGTIANGLISFGGGTEVIPPVVALNALGEHELSAGVINALAMTSAGDTPIAWSNLTSVAGSPAIAATLDADGNFSWDPAGSLAGKKGTGQVVYRWEATASNEALGAGGGTHTAAAFEVILIPEPATMSLFGLAMIACVGILRRRG